MNDYSSCGQITGKAFESLNQEANLFSRLKILSLDLNGYL